MLKDKYKILRKTTTLINDKYKVHIIFKTSMICVYINVYVSILMW